MDGAEIGGNLDCREALLKSTNEPVFIGKGLQVHGTTYFSDGFMAYGEVNIEGAIFDGNFVCNKATFSKSSINAFALSADGLKVGGNLFMSEDVKTDGIIRLRGLKCSGRADFGGINLAKAELQDAQLYQADFSKTEGFSEIDWGHGVLYDITTSWPSCFGRPNNLNDPRIKLLSLFFIVTTIGISLIAIIYLSKINAKSYKRRTDLLEKEKKLEKNFRKDIRKNKIKLSHRSLDKTLRYAAQRERLTVLRLLTFANAL